MSEFKIYTKTGDAGDTSIFGGRRLSKHHIRIEAYGTVDELNANIGLIRDHQSSRYRLELLRRIQDRLFVIGSNLASDPAKDLPVPAIMPEDVTALEVAIDQLNEHLPDLKHFILPGGHPVVSYCHLARCVCRRAERRVVGLAQEETVNDVIIQYLNRLSDFLFVLARAIGQEQGVSEVIWTPQKG